MDFREDKEFNASFDKLLKHITGNSKVNRPSKKHSIYQTNKKKLKALESSIPIKDNPNIEGIFKKIINTPKAFITSCLVSFGASLLTASLSLLSYKTNGIPLSLTLFFLVTIITWSIFVLIGSLVWFVSWFLRGKGGGVKSVSAFLYITPCLAIGKLVEILARIERDKELLKGNLSSSTTENMISAIYSNPSAFTSETLVFIFYIFFYFLLIRLFCSVHGFGFFKSAFAGVCILFFMSGVVTLIQRPIIFVLLNTFKNSG